MGRRVSLTRRVRRTGDRGSKPPLYRLFGELSAQIGVGSTAVYEGLCFDLETFVFEADGADVLQPLVDDGTASMIESVDELARRLGSGAANQFDREWFFKSNSVANILKELERIREIEE